DEPSDREEVELDESAFDAAAKDIDLDLPTEEDDVDEATWQEVATKLDLAGAYVEIGDADGARDLLNEIISKGDSEQVAKAKELLASLG
ncbi:MAG: FimV/HubP family polar landmark protein, partial [Limnobacter sp.]|nr:FimV/HubP family polar landmark protein [Limnobacter sp.]